MTDDLLLYSGGLDSECLRLLWTDLVPECTNPTPALLYVDMRTTYSRTERAHVEDAGLVDYFATLDLGEWERTDLIVPMRNLLLCAVATNYTNDDGHTRLALAATAGDRVLDKTQAFAMMTSDLLTFLWQPQHWTAGKEVSVMLPAKELTKTELVRRVAADGHNLDELDRMTFSCYYPRSTRTCGECKPCRRKWVAFAANGRPDLADPDGDTADHVYDNEYSAMAHGDWTRGDTEGWNVLDAMAAAKYVPADDVAELRTMSMDVQQAAALLRYGNDQ